MPTQLNTRKSVEDFCESCQNTKCCCETCLDECLQNLLEGGDEAYQFKCSYSTMLYRKMKRGVV